MKKLVTPLLFIVFLLAFGAVNGQTFRIVDTIRVTPFGANNIFNNIFNLSNDSVTLDWKIVSSDFPASWLTGPSGESLASICDNTSCYSANECWPSSKTHTTRRYGPGSGNFLLQLNLPATAETGTHTMRIKLTNHNNPTDIAYAAFIVTKSPNNVAQLAKTADDEITLYPNPAYNELNVTFPANIDVRTIGVYNNIGKLVSVFKVATNSANLSLETMPGGIYFARLMDSNGTLVATRRFTKQ